MINPVIAVVGLGYVGLPLAVEFGKRYKTIGFEVSKEKIANYENSYDPTGEVSKLEFGDSKKLDFSSDPVTLKAADIVIVAVPTPVDQNNNPDFTPLVKASTTVGKNMKKGVTVVYESTVYPGATEEVCIPLLEKHSSMKWKSDFNVGYSP